MHLLAVSSAAPTTVVSLDEAKAHLRVDYEDEDALITALIAAAVDWVEETCGQDFRTRQWRIERATTFTRLEFPRGPVKSVEAVGLRPDPWEPATIALVLPADYRLEEQSREHPARLIVREDVWPDLPGEDDRAVVVDFTTGWLDVPPAVHAAHLLHISTLFHAREDQILTTNAMPSQLGIERLLAMYRIPHYR